MPSSSGTGHGVAWSRRVFGLTLAAFLVVTGMTGSSAPSRLPRSADAASTARSGPDGDPSSAATGDDPGTPLGAGTGTGPAVGAASEALAASDARTLPADLPGEPGSDACTAATAPGWLAAENRRPGTPLPVHGAGFPGGAVQAVPLATSARCGDTVDVAVSAPPGQYVLRAWRVGFYAGAGGRVAWTSPPFAASRQGGAVGPAATAGGPGWRPTTRLAVTAGWLPGLYLVEVRGVAGPATGWFPFVVRGATDPASRSPAVYLVPTLTWAAYNPFGGASLYRATSGPASTAVHRRARVVALGRPLVDAGQRQVADYTAPLVETLEAAGVDVDYLTDVDVDAAPSLLAGRAEVIVGSHAEYVTTRLYDALEGARNAGTNLAFLGANQVYWHVLLVRDGRGAPQQVRLHRVLAEDPARTTAPQDTTVRWRDAPLRRPEALLIGAQYRGLGVVSPLLPLDPPAWTGLAAGVSLPAAASGEIDAVTPSSPPGVQVIAQGTTRRGKGWVDAAATYYTAPSGAAVLDTASIDTGCLARNTCYLLPAPPATRRAMHDLVVRVVTAFATPRFGATHPSDPTAGGRLTGAALAGRYGVLATGTSVSGDDD